MRRTIWQTMILVALFAVMPLQAQAAADTSSLGVVLYENPELRGRLLPAEDVASSGLVRTASQRAILHLQNGQVLKLATNSCVLLESTPHDEIKVTVLSGRATYWGSRGRPIDAGAGGWVLLERSSRDAMAIETVLLDHDARTSRDVERSRGGSRSR